MISIGHSWSMAVAKLQLIVLANCFIFIQYKQLKI